MARVINANIDAATLNPPGSSDAFVTAAEDIAGISTSQDLAQRLTMLNDKGELVQGPFAIYEFDTPTIGVASPVFRDYPGFIGGGLRTGGAREFVIPNFSLMELTNLVKRIIP